MAFSISVIIPAYNVERFIETAIQSAVRQLEVGEVVVIDDGSTDTTWAIIQSLQIVYDKLKVYQHERKVNRGRSATRNLGIKMATKDYIAFLDADDFYLENRFKNDLKILEANKNIDGVYNAVGFHFYRKARDNEKEKLKMSTVSKKIPPEELFNSIVSSKYGYLHLNGLTIKKSVFDKVGFFNELLVVAEDSDILFKMALKCQLESGIIDRPVAIRGVHEANIFTREDLFRIFNIKLYESTLRWSCKNDIPIKNLDTLLKWLWFFKYRDKSTMRKYIFYWGFLFSSNPRILFSVLSVKYFPPIRLRKKMFPYLFQSD
ncbi:glycosyltransferase family 2 protein [Flavobacterium acetivorans]|uniref:glycosyltransferase family 2 protein n=1 Tax=Flavobacterium acetivorans TaxID=2893883 RepID=UPI001E2EC57F|nr:glycosyltransferase family 2 protein [Flavobacterium sp. F-29]UFH35717.1 glycosyltransferase family 2 protein [Flavobacterium sp. F-29]